MNTQFQALGYCHSTIQLDKELVLKAKEEALSLYLDKKLSENYENSTGIVDPQQLSRIVHPHLTSAGIRQLILSKEFQQAAQLVCDSSLIKVWGCQLYIKPDQSAYSSVGFHTDFQHMPYFGGKVITAWLPLGKFGAHSGSIAYVKGSNLWSLDIACLGAQHLQINQQLKDLKSQVSDKYTLDLDVIDCDVGDVFFHSNKTIHGSGPNQSDEFRVALAIGLVTNETTVDDTVPDYGYGQYINDETICPTIFKRT
ncbi:hypothetical protein A7985_05220 [Pseudoalteromonas luteoviolacea]|uniref:Phytanoyl-CoA dioxygenase n=1 Tax=Pseudoalteromonas luteoviolacea TaxID=43657 RepID=A0A1C0TVI9_9GAMM|nr:phytanoyl-CoA dioxygenase family protein [Pseudoalteromonas luteoviolacea]OCQ23346.1 hypothetical protein A7985_05220 [Pseudoalteromonas luteoviolacea]